MLKTLRMIRDCGHGFRLYLVFLVGRVPVHQFRIQMYRHVFGVSIGNKTSFHWRAVFFAPEGVSIGNNTIIGNDCFLDGRKNLDIGDCVNIGGHVQIFTLEHDPQAHDFGVKGGQVRIDDYAYVASRSTILPGVRIGEGAVVAAGAVVTRDVDAYTIVGGVPARPIGFRSKDLDYKLNYHLPFQ